MVYFIVLNIVIAKDKMKLTSIHMYYKNPLPPPQLSIIYNWRTTELLCEISSINLSILGILILLKRERISV